MWRRWREPRGRGSLCLSGDSMFECVEIALVEGLGVPGLRGDSDWPGESRGGENFTGRGKRDLFFLLRRGNLNRVVVVEMV